MEKLPENAHLDYRGDGEIQSIVGLKKIVKVLIEGSSNPPVWVYVGSSRDYLIIPRTFCSCMDFIINVMSKGVKPYCKHIVAQYIVEEKGLYREVRVPNMEILIKIINEILDLNISSTLRRYLHSLR